MVSLLVLVFCFVWWVVVVCVVVFLFVMGEVCNWVCKSDKWCEEFLFVSRIMIIGVWIKMVWG